MRSRAAGRARIGAVVLVLALLAACGDDEPAASPDLGSSSSSTTSSTTSSTALTTTSLTPEYFVPVDHAADAGTDGDVLLDGRHFGFITTLVAGPDEIVGQFDLAEFYGGAEAAAASEADGHGEIEGGEEIYIRNDNPKLRPITVDPDALVYDIHYGGDDCCEPKPTSPAEFVARRDEEHEDRTTVNLTIEGGRVTEIQEVYFE